MKTPRIGHDHEIEIGPPLLKPAPKLVKQPARIEMIENEIAKLEKPDQERFRSWLYPSLARCFSSSVSSRAMCSDWFVCFGHVAPFSECGADCPEARPAPDALVKSPTQNWYEPRPLTVEQPGAPER